VVHKNFDVAESLIRNGTDSDIMDSNGKTPFELIENNDIKERLVKRHKARELKEKEENSKLFDGAAQGDMVKVFQCLAVMTATSAVTASNIPGTTSSSALKTNEGTNIIGGNAGKLVIASELINIKNEEDQSALLLAVCGGQSQVRSLTFNQHCSVLIVVAY
jgi:ankyrin repeat protein